MGIVQEPTLLLSALPPRQRQVINLILAGQAPKNIAFTLGLSVHTVREHIDTVYRKFGVHGRDELMARFISNQIDSPQR